MHDPRIDALSRQLVRYSTKVKKGDFVWIDLFDVPAAVGQSLIREVTAGKTLVMVEHDMGVVFGLADRISVLVYGEVIASGSPAEIRADARVKEAYLGTQAEAA